MPKPSSPSLAYVVQAAMDKRLRNLNKVIPGTIVSYSSTHQTCTVKPGVHRLVPNDYEPELDEIEELPAVQGVPVMWPRGRNFQVVGTLGAGDPVLILCSDREFSGWRAKATPTAPMDGRLHSLANAIALPGLDTTAGAFSAPSDAAALASQVDMLIGILKGWTPVSGDGGAALKTAITTAFPSHAATPAPTPTTKTTAASTVLKLDS